MMNKHNTCLDILFLSFINTCYDIIFESSINTCYDILVLFMNIPNSTPSRHGVPVMSQRWPNGEFFSSSHYDSHMAIISWLHCEVTVTNILVIFNWLQNGLYRSDVSWGYIKINTYRRREYCNTAPSNKQSFSKGIYQQRSGYYHS